MICLDLRLRFYLFLVRISLDFPFPDFFLVIWIFLLFRLNLYLGLFIISLCTDFFGGSLGITIYTLNIQYTYWTVYFKLIFYHFKGNLEMLQSIISFTLQPLYYSCHKFYMYILPDNVIIFVFNYHTYFKVLKGEK